jgi:DNA-binding protein
MIKRSIPLAAVERIIKQADPDARIADSAKEELRDELEKYALSVAEKSWKLAEHANRRTVKEEDVALSSEHY